LTDGEHYSTTITDDVQSQLAASTTSRHWLTVLVDQLLGLAQNDAILTV
jgi:hypothetical protein